jgi:hypothetical protein
MVAGYSLPSASRGDDNRVWKKEQLLGAAGERGGGWLLRIGEALLLAQKRTSQVVKQVCCGGAFNMFP